MSEAGLSTGCINELKAVLGSISDDDCVLLKKTYGGEETVEIIQKVYEGLDSSKFSTVEELVTDLRRLEADKLSNGDPQGSWTVARSKSANGVYKGVATLQSTLGRSTSPGIGGSEPRHSLPFSGTQNPVQILRSSRNPEGQLIRTCLSKMLQDSEQRKFLQDVYDNQEKKQLILLRGASGSGKSTLAQVLWAITNNGEICSADNYFMSRNGVYKFNRSALSDAHESCKNHCRIALNRGDTPVIIDNTNTRVDEMLPYVQLALDYDYDVQMVEPKTEWKKKAGILAQKNLHGVPKNTISDQLERFETTTVKAMINLLVKRSSTSQPKNQQRQPPSDLHWDNGNGAAKDSWRNPVDTTTISSFTPMPGAMAISSPTKQRTTNTSPTMFSWSEPPPPGPSTILLSDYIASDLKRSGSNESVPKQKRSGRRTAGGNTASETSTPTKVPQPHFEDPMHAVFNRLVCLFPNVPKNTMEDVFNLYEGDMDACAAALMEDGAEMTGSVEQPTENGYRSETPREDETKYEWGGCNGVTSSSVEAPEVSVKADESESESGSDPDTTLERLELALPIDFVKRLLRIYGDPEEENRNLTGNELIIKISDDAAFEIYKSVYYIIHKPEIEGTSTQDDDSTRSDSPIAEGQEASEEELNEIAISLSLMELETTSGDPNLSSIIELEKKIDEQSKQILKGYSSRHRTMAQNVTFGLLKQEYPVLEPSVVEEVYMQSFLNPDTTRAWLTEIYPQSKAELKASNTEPTTSNWRLRYNPKDVKSYSGAELTDAQKTHDDLEEAWTELMERMRECHAKCKVVSNPQIKAHYITQARALSEKMKDTTDEMQHYKAILMNSKHKNEQILDLHGLKIGGAMRILKDFLHASEQEFAKAGIPKSILLIITGQGKHSRNGCPVLQPAVRNYLSNRKYRYHSSKPGTYCVILTRGWRPRS